MPTYEYRCTICGTPFEARRLMTDDAADVACPSGHREVRRVFSVFAAATSAGRAGGAEPAMGGGGGGGCCGGACGCG